MKDITGKEIAVGDHIVYAVRKGNKAAMKSGTVIATRRNGSGVVVDAIENSRPAVLEHSERIAVVGRP